VRHTYFYLGSCVRTYETPKGTERATPCWSCHEGVCIQGEPRGCCPRAGADESIARQVVREVLGAPGSIEIGLTNQNVRAMGREVTVTGVDFSIGQIKSSE
jgi:hypothetical protein